MALQINKTYHGVVCSYHRLTTVTDNKSDGTTHAELASYVSADTRHADGEGNIVNTQSFDFAGVPDVEPLTWAYGKIKGLMQADGITPGDWAAATDV